MDNNTWSGSNTFYIDKSKSSEYITHDFLNKLTFVYLSQPNLVDVISSTCGWHPLEIGQTMNIHNSGKSYQITRLKDD